MNKQNDLTIGGANLQLTAFTPQHITSNYLGWLNDRNLMRFSRQRFSDHTVDSAAKYLETYTGSPHFFWAIETLQDCKCIGTLTASVDQHHHTADLGLMIGDALVQGQGFGLEAWSLAMDYLFKTENIRKITGGTNSLNLAMTCIMHKAEMTPEGCQKEQELIDGTPSDILYFGKLNDNWKHA